MGCIYFNTLDLKTDNVVCNFNGGNARKVGAYTAKGLAEINGGSPEKSKIRTNIDELTALLYKHKKLVLDTKLIGHLNMTPKQVNNYVQCLERYKFVRTYMDPLHGMTIVWTDNTDLVSNGYSNGFIRSELQKRKAGIA